MAAGSDTQELSPRPAGQEKEIAKTIAWTNAEVDLPILSTHELANDEDTSVIRNKIIGNANGFISQGDVYWIALLVPKSLVGDKPQGFGRPG